jgi:NAD(P)H-nitrite reductase large subunit
MKHVIIGNGPAGVIAAETIRKNAPDDKIVLIGDEAHPPYSRMAIPHLLAGEINEAGTLLRKEPDYFNRLRIQLWHGRVAHVSARTRTVKMEDGSVLGFDRLLIASGARPRVPTIPGIDFPGVHACWTLDDALAISKLAKPNARAILIGAGFIGCILMEALGARGLDLTIIEKRDRMLPGMMGKNAGEMIKRWCIRKGVKVHTGVRVVAIGSRSMQEAASRIVRLSNGQQLEADLIVHATGTTPNVGFLRGSGIHCLRGVVVDASMQTNLPGVYAAGDCAETFDYETGRSVIAGVQPNAADQAYCAALNMTGKHAFQRGVRQIDVLDTLGLISSSFGQWQGVRGGQWVEAADESSFRYLRLEFSRDVLIGCNAVGVTEDSGILRELIQNQVRLGAWKDKLLQDPTLLEEAYRECVQDAYVHQASAFRPPGGVGGDGAHYPG